MQCDVESFPPGVKLFMWSRLVRWLGWGFGESLIPIFIFSLSVSYAEAGLMNAAYNLALLCSLPIIGSLVDRTSAKTFVIIALIAYPFVGVGYFLAGVTGMAGFIIFARALNGVTWAFEGTGIDTYYRRTTNRACLSSSFGFIETWTNFGWILAALVGIVLIKFFPVHYLLLAIAPFSLLALPLALKAPADKAVPAPQLRKMNSYAAAFVEFRNWNVHLHLLAGLVLMMGIISSLVGFFVPIDAYVEGASLTMVILLGVVATLPMLFGFPFGRIADRHNKYILIALTLILSAVVVAGLSVFPYYWFKLVASFLLGLLAELLVVTGKSLVTTLGPEETYGLRGSVFEGISTLGKLAAPLLIGITLDVIGFSNMTLITAVIAGTLGLGFVMLERDFLRGYPEPKK
jgi:MFS family permease